MPTDTFKITGTTIDAPTDDRVITTAVSDEGTFDVSFKRELKKAINARVLASGPTVQVSEDAAHGNVHEAPDETQVFLFNSLSPSSSLALDANPVALAALTAGWLEPADHLSLSWVPKGPLFDAVPEKPLPGARTIEPCDFGVYALTNALVDPLVRVTDVGITIPPARWADTGDRWYAFAPVADRESLPTEEEAAQEADDAELVAWFQEALSASAAPASGDSPDSTDLEDVPVEDEVIFDRASNFQPRETWRGGGAMQRRPRSSA